MLVQSNVSAAILTVDNDGDITFGASGSSFTFPSADGSSNQILETDGAGTLTWVNNNITKQGRVALTTGWTGATVTFGAAFSSTSYVVHVDIEYFGGGAETPSVYSLTVDNRATTGFDVLFSGAIDNPGTGTYYLHWTARAD